jgi:hypothetical protein
MTPLREELPPACVEEHRTRVRSVTLFAEAAALQQADYRMGIFSEGRSFYARV